MIKEKLPDLNLNSIFAHGGLKQLTGEIDKCIKYFQKENSLDGSSNIKIHTSRIGVSKLAGNVYIFEERVFYGKDVAVPYKEVIKIEENKISKKRFNLANGTQIPFTQYLMDKEEVEQIINKIHNITFPYAQHIREEQKDVR